MIRTQRVQVDKVIRRRGVLVQGELQSITVIVDSPRIIKDLRANVTIAERKATWRKTIDSTKCSSRVMLPLLNQRRNTKKIGMLKHHSL